MAFNKSNIRSKKRKETENLYKILNTRSNATEETIKKKYIESIRQFPPESHPEQFQQIRRAYETLRNPLKRREYDLHRKYGGKMETMLEEAFELSEQSEWEQAGDLYNKILEIDSSSVPALLGIAHVALHAQTPCTVDEYFDKAYECTDSVEVKLDMRIYQARLLFQHDMSVEALDLLNQIKQDFPDASELTVRLYVGVYMDLGRDHEAWEHVTCYIKEAGEQRTVEMAVYIDWIHLMIRLNKWNLFSQVQTQVRRFLKSLSDEDDRQSAILELMEEHDEYREEARFREALIFVEFASYLDPRDKELKEDMIEAKKYAQLDKEIDRMVNDEDMFPLITMHAIEWFYEDFMDYDSLHSFRNSIPASSMAEMEDMDEGYAYGIARLKKKYNLIYREYRDEWDHMYGQKTSTMNREQRRQIR
jgi:tetratricopeptide (TPR) repeat protein